jgi:hypothetical protein
MEGSAKWKAGPTAALAGQPAGLKPFVNHPEPTWVKQNHQPTSSLKGVELMTFTIHASKHGEIIESHRTSPEIAVAQARMLDMAGWQVQITDRASKQYPPEEFD